MIKLGRDPSDRELLLLATKERSTFICGASWAVLCQREDSAKTRRPLFLWGPRICQHFSIRELHDSRED